MQANENFSGTGASREITQAGAICYRQGDGGVVEILLIGSRRNGRWGIPKGHIDEGETSGVAAKRESFEEAGVIGRIDQAIFGFFAYVKDSAPHRYHVTVHLIEVVEIALEYPERGTRKQSWFPLPIAAREASQPGLRALLMEFGSSHGVPFSA